MGVTHWTRTAAAILLAALLTSCGGGGGGDSPPPADPPVTLAARAVDGYLAGALAFVDVDGDGLLDADEPRALTDSSGYFGRNRRNGIDYCRAGASERERRYCLRMSGYRSDAPPVVRVVGGYDVATGEPFDGTLSTRDARLGTDEEAPLLSPIAALLEGAGDRRAEMLTRLGLSSEDTAIETDFVETADAELTALALKGHKVLTALADRLRDQYPALGGNESFPTDAGALAYQELADRLLEDATDFDALMDDPTALDAVLEGVEERVRSLYDAYNASATTPLTLPARLSAEARAARAQRAVRVGRLVDRVIRQPQQARATQQQLLGGARAVEIVLKKIIQGDDAVDTNYDAAATWAENNPGELTVLAGENVNLASLIEREMTPTGSQAALAIIPADALTFTAIPGMRLDLTVTDPDRIGGATIYFQGSTGATSGDAAMCVSYTASSGESVLEQFFQLSWERLSDHGVMLAVTDDQENRSAILKSVGRDAANGNRPLFRFDIGGDLGEWSGQEPVAFDPAHIPASDADCAGTSGGAAVDASVFQDKAYVYDGPNDEVIIIVFSAGGSFIEYYNDLGAPGYDVGSWSLSGDQLHMSYGATAEIDTWTVVADGAGNLTASDPPETETWLLTRPFTAADVVGSFDSGRTFNADGTGTSATGSFNWWIDTASPHGELYVSTSEGNLYKAYLLASSTSSVLRIASIEHDSGGNITGLSVESSNRL